MVKVIKRRIIKSDSVYVIKGDDKGKVGKVLKVLRVGPFSLKLLVSGVNVKNFTRKDPSGSKVISKEFPIDISSVKYFDSNDNTKHRVGFKFVNGKKVRYCKSSQRVIG